MKSLGIQTAKMKRMITKRSLYVSDQRLYVLRTQTGEIQSMHNYQLYACRAECKCMNTIAHESNQYIHSLLEHNYTSQEAGMEKAPLTPHALFGFFCLSI